MPIINVIFLPNVENCFRVLIISLLLAQYYHVLTLYVLPYFTI